MKKAIFTLALIFSAMVSYGQSQEIYVSPEADKLVTKSSSGVMLTFQNDKYDYVQDIESIVIGSVSKTIQVLEAALKGLSDDGDNIVEYGSFYTADFGFTNGVIFNRNAGDEYTVLTPSEIKLILQKLKS